ncbi:MAG: R3H domain-containing nucleic acid-binding protein [Caldisericia bacterium]
MVLTTASYEQKKPKSIKTAHSLEIPIYSIPKNTLSHVKRIIKGIKRNRTQQEVDQAALDDAIEIVFKENRSVRLPAAPASVRRFQHKFGERFGLITSSIGREPDRSVVYHPPDFTEFETEFEEENENI